MIFDLHYSMNKIKKLDLINLIFPSGGGAEDGGGFNNFDFNRLKVSTSEFSEGEMWASDFVVEGLPAQKLRARSGVNSVQSGKVKIKKIINLLNKK